MTHFAVIAPPFPSHFRTLEALSVHLLERGHRVTFVHMAEARALLHRPGVEFAAVGHASHPPGSLAGIHARSARPGSPAGLRRVILDMAGATDMLCREGPARLHELGVEALLADQMEAAGGLLAERLGLPWVSVACALPVNREPRLPLPVMHWRHADTPAGERLNQGSCRVYDWLMRPHAQVIARHAETFGLPPRSGLHECLSPYAQISQTTRDFDFPRLAAPAHFHPLGPLRLPADTEPPLNLPGATGAPLIFASLGTLQGGRLSLFRRIAHACRDLGVQSLLTHCGGLDANAETALRRAGATWVSDFVPPGAALARADAVITHAGLNTVMDALSAGTPLLALPIAFDQPGVAARLVRAGAGLRVLPALADRATLRHRLERLLTESSFAERAARLGAGVRAAGGAARAVEIIEAVVARRAPVLREADDAACA